ncbi:MAG: ABC transporter permease [Chloroflexota bacterium]|nr:ABC transporter permease [Chloroflexota bacterium]MXZ63544.1 ABC transporter permease [Chloroflexota bacterium]
MSSLADSVVVTTSNVRGQRHWLLDASIRVVRKPVGFASALVIAVLVGAALSAPYVAPFDPIAISIETFQAPNMTYFFGTDDLGRDMFSRILHGSRISLYVGFLAVCLGSLGGALVGLISGFAGGWIDMVIQRIVDAVLAFPGIVLAMSLVAVLGTSTTNALLAIAIVIIPFQSRVVRGAVLSVKQNVYIEAAQTIGATPQRIMFRHVLPNVVAPILILISASLGNAILIEAGLSFLGLSTQPPEPSWGLMLSGTGRRYMEEAPWLAIFPGMAIAITVLAFNLLGDVIRDVLDPRLRGT